MKITTSATSSSLFLNVSKSVLLFIILILPGYLVSQTLTVSGNLQPTEIDAQSQTIIAPDLTISFNGNITDFTVSITNSFTASDQLSYNGSLPSGVTTAGWNASTRSIVFKGTLSAQEWQNFLRNVTITSGPICSPETRQVTFVAEETFYNPLNGHFYRLTSTSQSWTATKAEAGSTSFFGREAYLVTLTSNAENIFVTRLVGENSWMGASDDHNQINEALGYELYADTNASEGKFYWVTGPEKGTQLTTANSGTPNNQISGVFQNWRSGEPNDYNNGNPGESFGHVYAAGGDWNDFPNSSSILGIMEFGGMPNDQTISTPFFTKDISINGAPGGEIIGGDVTVCSGTNSTTLTITGLDGSVVRWESSDNNFIDSPTVINNTSTSLTVDNISTTTYYRAVVNTNAPTGCSNLVTSSAPIYVAQVNAGNVFAQNTTICENSDVELFISGQEGNVQKWQRSTDNVNWTDISETSTSLSETIATAGTYYYRAVVEIPSCGLSANTASKEITVVSGTPPVGGTVSSAVHPATTNSGTLTLTGYTGTITKWQRSTDNGIIWTDISNTADTYAYSNIATETLFRAVLTNGSCGSAFSAAGTVSVLSSPSITNFTPDLAGNGTTVTISGTGFTGTTSVQFGNTNASSFTVVSDTEITAVVGTGASGDVTVTNPAGNDSASDFTYLVAQYDFEGNPLDETENNYDGVEVNIVTYGTGAQGQAICFDDGPGFVRLPDGLISGLSEFTISLRFKTTGTGAILGQQNVLGSPANTPTNYIPILLVTDDGRLKGTLWTSTNTSIQAISTDPINDGNWHQVDFTAGTNSVAIYIDGNLEASTSGATVSHLDMIYNQLGLAQTNGYNLSATSWEYFDGCLDDLLIVDRALSQAEIETVTALPEPTITSFAPTTAQSGATITLTGTNFDGATQVTFGGVNVASFTVDSNTQITAVLGVGATGDVAVTTAGGTATSNGFSYLAQEICNNGIDDDGDGLIDCFDGSCAVAGNCDDFYFNQPEPACQGVFDRNGNFEIEPIFSTDNINYPIDQRSGVFVGDMDGDGLPDLVAKNPGSSNISAGGATQGPAIHVFSGVDGSIKQSFSVPANNPFSMVALGDVDNDGLGDIFLMNEDATVQRYEYGTATPIWTSSALTGSNMNHATPHLADFNEDGVPEVYVGISILNALTGAIIIDSNNNLSSGRNVSNDGDRLPIAFDVFQNGDVKPSGGNFGSEADGLELIAGNVVYTVDIAAQSLEVASTVTFNEINGKSSGNHMDGFTSIADLNGDDQVDVILVSAGMVYAYDPRTQTQLASSAFAIAGNSGGRANVGDFDNDGAVEIGVAGQNEYYVLEYTDDANPFTVKWSKTGLDDGSQRTGSTLFDFEGDGINEVIYSEEEHLFVYDGETGAELTRVVARAGTRTEYPLVADVNGDGQSEIIITAQPNNGPSNSDKGYVTVYRSARTSWVNSRETWNQHGYYVTNVNNDLSIPQQVQNPYLSEFDRQIDGVTSGAFNGFLVQTTLLTSTGVPTLAATDAYGEITNFEIDNAGVYTVTFTLSNAAGVEYPLPQGMKVSLWNGHPEQGGTFIDVQEVDQQIAPGETVPGLTFQFSGIGNVQEVYLVANNSGSRSGNDGTFDVFENFDFIIAECDYENNIISLAQGQTLTDLAPQFDFNGANELGFDTTASFTENSGPLVLEAVKTLVFDADDDEITGAIVALTNPLNASDETLDVDLSATSANIQKDYTNGVLTLTGNASANEYQALMRTLSYDNTNDNPDETERIVEATITDATGKTSNIATVTISVTSANDAPTSADFALDLVEDTPYAFEVTDFQFNDPDQGDSFNGIQITVLPVTGTLTYQGNPVTLNQFIEDVTQLQYTGASGEFGNSYSSFGFKVKDNDDLVSVSSYTLTINILEDTDGDGDPNATDPDDDGDGTPDTEDDFPVDPNEDTDTDGDGTGDNADDDDDNDGTPDAEDDFPLDPNEDTDSDGDGTGDNADDDDDNDGTPDEEDDFPVDPNEDTDTDGDGTGDNADDDDDNDGTPDTEDDFPLDPNEDTDTDGDGTGDNADDDDDNDGQTDTDENSCGSDPLDAASLAIDTDGDNVPDCIDTDDDGDGTPDSEDDFPTDPNEDTDTDGDGTGDNTDDDDDNDGTPDTEDDFPTDPDEDTDTDGDGTGDNEDTDDDGDGTPDTEDDFPKDPNEDTDTDGDGTGDNTDDDIDGDGIPNNEDQYPNGEAEDRDNDGVPDADDDFPDDSNESVDSDGDGTGDNEDTDDDNDGTPDTEDAFPWDPNEDTDTDGDGTGNNADDDDDNDGTKDDSDKFPLDPNEDSDLDNDGIGDNMDRDDDGDGVMDNEDAFPTDKEPSLVPAQAFTPNGDGNNDAWVVPGIDNYPNNVVKVFNRWGNLVYEAISYQNDWEGFYKDNREKLPPGSYLYVIDLGDGSPVIRGWIFLNY